MLSSLRRARYRFQHGRDLGPARLQRHSIKRQPKPAGDGAGGLPIQGQGLPHCLAVVVARGDVHAAFEQLAGNVRRAQERRCVQGGIAVAGARVHIDPVIEEPVDRPALPACRRRDQRGDAEFGLHRIEVGAGSAVRHKGVDVSARGRFPEPYRRRWNWLRRRHGGRGGCRGLAGRNNDQRCCARDSKARTDFHVVDVVPFTQRGSCRGSLCRLGQAAAKRRPLAPSHPLLRQP